MSVQIIERDGEPEYVVLAYNEYKKLVEAAEALEDIRAYDDAKRRIAGGEELIPSEVTFALLDGENPIRVWRQHRKFTLQHLADQAGISKSYLSQLELGKRSGSTEVLRQLAKALDVSLDDLV